MAANRHRYPLERVHDCPPWGQRLQDSIQRALDRVTADADTVTSSASTASTGTGTSYAPARAADWAGTAPTTVQEALDRLAYHAASGAGAAPIVELP